MKNLIFIFLFCITLLSFTNAQDTIIVQTIGFDTMHRSGYYQFPNDPSTSYAKILMQYTQKCWDDRNPKCGEWDYSCNTFITDMTTQDSFRLQHYDYSVLGIADPYFAYLNTPTYTLVPKIQKITQWTPGADAKSILVGNGLTSINFDDDYEENQSLRIRLTKNQLSNLKLVNNRIEGISLFALDGKDNIKNFGISYLQVNATDTLAVYQNSGFVTCYYNEHALKQDDENVLPFYNPIQWDGSSDIILRISYTSEKDKFFELKSEQFIDHSASSYSNIESTKAINFRGTEFISIPQNAFPKSMDEITISFWAKGDPDKLPANTCLYESTDPQGQRQVNIHLPWSDQNVYWDCGNEGSGYDRINVAVNKSIYAGNWAFWTFTKNAKTGVMNIYVNGKVIANGTGKNLKIQNIEKTILGMNQNFNCIYTGLIDQFSVFNKALDSNEIFKIFQQGLYSTSYYNDILFSYPMEHQDGLLEDYGPKHVNIPFYCAGSVQQVALESPYKISNEIEFVPQIKYFSGSYVRQTTDQITYDTIYSQGRMVIHYGTRGSKLIGLDTSYIWDPGFNYTLDQMGQHADSTERPFELEIGAENLDYYNSVPSKYELLSFVTPYGIGLDLGQEGKKFTFDVTDFYPILKGNKKLSVELGGEWQEKLDIKFLFIKGKPARNVLGIQNIWPFSSNGYADISNNNTLEPRTAILSNNASSFKLRASVTGHQQNGEFTKRTHFINLNGGTREFNFDVWKECSTVPIYPQGGTWLFDRAGWCPGDPTTLFEFNMDPYVKPGQSVEFDYGVLGTQLSEANYLVTTQLVSYGPINFKTNASLTDIIKPSTRVEFQRFNPACSYPRIRVRNEGSDPITSMQIEYSFQGGIKESYMWTGQLDFLKSVDIDLPVLNTLFWSPLNGKTEGLISIDIVKVNNKTDENDWDNHQQSKAIVPALYKEKLQIACTTNARGAETHYSIRDAAGQVILDRKGLANSKAYTDDLTLASGCYSIEMQDSGDDGLYYWYYDRVGQGVGRGSFLLKKYSPTGGGPVTVVNFNPEFGRYIYYDFIVGGLTSTDDENPLLEYFSVYPNPVQDELNIDIKLKHTSSVILNLLNLQGQLVQTVKDNFQGNKIQTFSMNVSNLEKGIYFLEVIQDDMRKTQKVIID